MPPGTCFTKQLTVLIRTGVAAAALMAAGVSAMAAEPIGWVAGVNGLPSIIRQGAVLKPHRGMDVQVGDRIETAAGAKIKILFDDDTILSVGPRSRVVVPAYNLQQVSRLVRLNVIYGRFKVNIARFFGGSSLYEVQTPTAVAGVRGTILWGDTELDAICSLEGMVHVRATGGTGSERESADLSAGTCVTQMADGQAVPLRPSREQIQGYLKEVTLE